MPRRGKKAGDDGVAMSTTSRNAFGFVPQTAKWGLPRVLVDPYTRGWTGPFQGRFWRSRPLRGHLQGLFEGPWQAPTQGSLPETRVRGPFTVPRTGCHDLIEGPSKRMSEGPSRGRCSEATVEGSSDRPMDRRGA